MLQYVIVNSIVCVVENIIAIMLQHECNNMLVHSRHHNDKPFNSSWFFLLEPRGYFFSHVLQRFPHDKLYFLQAPMGCDLAGAIDYFFALRINDAKVPPSAIG